MKLLDKHFRAADLVGRGVSYDKAGEDVGTTGRTITNWMAHPEFRTLVEQSRRDSLERARALIGGNLEAVARTLLGMATGAIKVDNRTRFAAAAWVLERSGLFDVPPANVETHQHLHLELPPGTSYADIERLRDELVARRGDRSIESTTREVGPSQS